MVAPSIPTAGTTTSALKVEVGTGGKLSEMEEEKQKGGKEEKKGGDSGKRREKERRRKDSLKGEIRGIGRKREERVRTGQNEKGWGKRGGRPTQKW